MYNVLIRRYFIPVIMFVIFSCFPLFGEAVSFYVLDKDLEIPLEGVRVVDTLTGAEAYTDFNGEAEMDLDVSGGRVIVVAELIGYEDKKVLLKEFDKPVTIEMIMEGLVVGEELVIEAEAIGESDEEVGVSTVIEKEVIRSTAKIGVIEDVLTAVKLLPGVSYGGTFGTSLSVRGSAPDGVTAAMDGFIVKYPYHWGGAFSIFNPNIVETVKFSTGIFSAKYGQATSGLLDVTTITPNDGFKFQANQSTSTIESFLQVPLGEKREAGFFAGARLTNYDLTLAVLNKAAELFNDETLREMLSGISRSPYIYDFYCKLNYRPSDRFEWYVNGFWGNDGVGSAFEDASINTEENIAYNFDFRYYNTDLFANTGVRILAGDNLLIHFLGGYEYWQSDIDAFIEEFGTHFYSDAFLDEYGLLVPPGEESFSVSTESSYVSSTVKHGVQGRLDFDLTPSSRVLLQFGLGTYLDFTDNSGSGSFWTVEYSEDMPVYRNVSFENTAENNRLVNSFAYLSSTFTLSPDLLELEAGFRVDHSYLMGAEGFSLNTYPVPGPRLTLRLTPRRRGAFFTSNTFTLGGGLFSKTPFETVDVTEEMGLQDFDVAVPKTVMSILGWETRLPLDFRFRIEGYYKYLYDSFYTNSITNEETNKREAIIRNDGFGHAAGFDVLFDKKTSRYFDGLISYSFIWARYQYPVSDGVESARAPREQWYYPSFHRFNTLNVMLNIKPVPWLTFTTTLSFATGTPKTEYDDKQMFAGYFEGTDGTTTAAEMYSRKSFYSDTLRSNISLPLDIKITFHNYFPNSKVKWELYIAGEDILSPLLYRLLPRDNLDTSLWNGEDQRAPSASFAFPIPSLGFQLSY